MNDKTYTIGDKVLVRHFQGNIRATIVEIGEANRVWGPQFLMRGPAGEFRAYVNEFITAAVSA